MDETSSCSFSGKCVWKISLLDVKLVAASSSMTERREISVIINKIYSDVDIIMIYKNQIIYDRE